MGEYNKHRSRRLRRGNWDEKRSDPPLLKQAMPSNPRANGRPKGKQPGESQRQTAHTHGSQTLPPDWRTWPELSVRIDNLPPDVQTQVLWQWFSPYGHIERLEIFSPRMESSTMSARVHFEPPPQLAFWAQGSLDLGHPNLELYPRGLKVKISPDCNPQKGWRESKVDPDQQRYPVKIAVGCHSVDWGSMVGATTMNLRKTLVASDTNRIKLELEVKDKRLIVYFPVLGEKKIIRHFKFAAGTAQIKTVFQISARDGSDVLVIPLPFAPHYYRQTDDFASSFSLDNAWWNIRDTWNRVTDVASNLDAPSLFPVAAANDIPDPGYIEIGRWTCIRLRLKSDTYSSQIEQLRLALEDLNVKFQEPECFKFTESDETVWDHLDCSPIAEGGLAAAFLQTDSPHVTLDFTVRYQLEVCLSRGVFNEHNVSVEFLQKLASLAPIDATRRLEYLVDKGETLHNPSELFEDLRAQYYLPNARIPSYCTLVRKANVTPTTIRFSSPIVEASNRVIRHYRHVQDRFLRVQFIEESETGRIFTSDRRSPDVWRRLIRALYQGIQIGDRRYEFLASGNSQFRQGGVYFFCPTAHISCDDIRRWMGVFDHIRNVAKFAARLGQCFSTTREMRGLPVPVIKRIPDVERNDHCFTDGVGIISGFLARMVMEEMQLDVFTEPSAFQFRMSGCKGVLAVWPRARGQEVYIRPSQEKFKADNKQLEIIRCARFANATLNRQTIIILESLGVPKRVFVDLLDNQICLHEKAMTSNSTAVEMLAKCVDENQSTLVLAEFLQAGFKTESLQEPFVLNLLRLWRSWSLKLLKEKARIIIEKSAFVLGCVDETATLRGHSNDTEGSNSKNVDRLPQIFLQLSDPRSYNLTRVIQGVCIVGRNPSLHPGDIRVVQAVDVPELHHLRDVVVFPSTGDRPVPSMLSGGDLDGDDFFVIWDPRLIPAEWNFPAMNYTANKPHELDRDVHVDDLKDFFVNYLKNDNLGLIATAHLGWADLSGPKSAKCLRLASLHSKAVDYSKTGDPAQMLNGDNPRRWPHFMEKKLVYHSQKALGMIYDRVIKQRIQFSPDWRPSFDQRISNRFKLDDGTLDEARSLKEQYDIAVRRILSQHSLGTEFELYSGWAMTGPAVGSDYKRQEDLGCEYDALKQRFRETCYEAAGGYDETKIDPFVAAMYRVTEEQINAALSESREGGESADGAAVDVQEGRLEAKSMPLMSFPWIFPEVMTRIAMGGRYNPKKSVLAAAHRVSVPMVPPKASQGRLGVSQGPIVGLEIANGHGAKGVENIWSEDVAKGLGEQDEEATQNQTYEVEIAGPFQNAMNRLSLFEDD